MIDNKIIDPSINKRMGFTDTGPSLNRDISPKNQTNIRELPVSVLDEDPVAAATVKMTVSELLTLCKFAGLQVADETEPEVLETEICIVKNGAIEGIPHEGNIAWYAEYPEEGYALLGKYWDNVEEQEKDAENE